MRYGSALLLALLWVGSCSSTPESGVEGRTLRATPLDPAQAQILHSARQRLESGDVRGASDRYASLAAANPDDAWLATLDQEARYAALNVDSSQLERNLRRFYRDAAEDDPTPIRLLLASRAETDFHAALYLADRALAMDPEFAWGLYARAHALTQLGEMATARGEVERAIAIEPGLLPAWRLLAWLRSQAGERDAAIETLRAWLEAATEDPRISRDTRKAAICDLGVLLVRSKRYEEAVGLLDEATSDESGRSSSVLAAAAAEIGGLEEALAAVRAARAQAPDQLLFVVQEALLLERSLPHGAAAEAAWKEVIDRTQGATDLSALLQRTRAEAHLKRVGQDHHTEEGGGETAE